MKEQLYQSIADLFSSQKYDPDWNERQPQLSSSKSRGRKNACLVRFLNESEGNGRESYQLNEEELQNRLRIFEAFLQPDQPFQVFVPRLCLRGFFDSIMRDKAPRSTYKGVSYNPNLIRDGEKLDNMDFFAWAKRIQESLPDFEFTVLDASPYQVMNQMNPRVPSGLRDSEFADWFYGQIEEGVSRNPDIQENCRLRNLYLRSLLGVSAVKGRVISALDLIQKRDPVLLKSFEEARNLCGVWPFGNGDLRVDRFVTYRRYGQEFSKTYTPAVVAEALFFLRENGIAAKLGPLSEIDFDKIIADVMKGRGDSYNFFWFSRPFEKTSTRKNRIYVQDDPDSVRMKIDADPDYGKWMDAILDPFTDEATVVDKVIDINQRIRESLSA